MVCAARACDRKGTSRLATPFKLACIGGAPGTCAALAHGVALAIAAPTALVAVELAFAEGDWADAETAAAYAALVGTHDGVPLTARAASIEGALDGADLVLCAGPSIVACQPLDEIYAAAGWCPPAWGPGAVAQACAAGPSFLEWARAAAARCPAAPLVTMTAPVDVLAGAARRRFGLTGLRTVGCSAEVEILRGRLAKLLDTPEEQLLLVHGGVDRVGWVVRFAVGGRDGYGDFGDHIQGLLEDPSLAPENRLIPEVYALTGMIRTSARQAWPFVFAETLDPTPETAAAVRSASDQQAMVAALRAGRPIAAPPARPADPEAEWNARGGTAVGRMVRAMATGDLAVVSLQVPYAGEALGWSPEITVEVPAVVGGPQIEPMAVGPLPAGVDGLPRLLGQQRALASDYLAAPDLSVLRRALAATPQWGRADQMRALAEGLHAAFAHRLEALARGV